MRIYIAGPMTGLPDFNRPAFHAAAAALRDVGINVCNPAEIKENPSASWKDYMREGINQLMFCDGIFMLEGWEKSKGAKLERHIAGELGLPISFQKPKAKIVGASPDLDKAKTDTAAKAKADDEEEAAIRRIASNLGLGKLCDCGNPDCPNSGLDVKIFRL